MSKPRVTFARMESPSGDHDDDKTSVIYLGDEVIGEITGFRDRVWYHLGGYRKVVEYHVDFWIAEDDDGDGYSQGFPVEDYPSPRAALAAARAFVRAKVAEYQKTI